MSRMPIRWEGLFGFFRTAERAGACGLGRYEMRHADFAIGVRALPRTASPNQFRNEQCRFGGLPTVGVVK